MSELISIILPAYNEADCILKTIDDVEAALKKASLNYEIIVIDDGSKDGTAEYLREKYGNKIRLIVQENKGLSGARNSGLAVAAGRYVALLDSDDLWDAEKLSKQVAYFESHPEFSVAC